MISAMKKLKKKRKPNLRKKKVRQRVTREKGAIYFRWMGRKLSFEEVIFTLNDPKKI